MMMNNIDMNLVIIVPNPIRCQLDDLLSLRFTKDSASGKDWEGGGWRVEGSEGGVRGE